MKNLHKEVYAHQYQFYKHVDIDIWLKISYQILIPVKNVISREITDKVCSKIRKQTST